MSKSRRSPFKQHPRRLPGESISERYRQRLARHFVEVTVLLCGLGLSIGLILAWFVARFIGLNALLAVGAMATTFVFAGCIWGLRRSQVNEQQCENDRLGAQGERIVAEVLDELRSDGYRVFHDVPPERDPRDGESLANFDHILVGPTGIYVIETKARSKTKGNNTIEISRDGRATINGRAPDRCPLVQAKTLAMALRQTLERETGLKDLPVKPVVIFPNWYIRDRAYRDAGGDVWTLNEPAFVKWLRRERVRLQPEEISRLADRVEQRVRAL